MGWPSEEVDQEEHHYLFDGSSPSSVIRPKSPENQDRTSMCRASKSKNLMRLSKFDWYLIGISCSSSLLFDIYIDTFALVGLAVFGCAGINSTGHPQNPEVHSGGWLWSPLKRFSAVANVMWLATWARRPLGTSAAVVEQTLPFRTSKNWGPLRNHMDGASMNEISIVESMGISWFILGI